MALWEAETRHARELSVFGEKRALLYTGVCELILSIYRRARTCPDLPGFARPCESSRPDSKPIPHAQVLWKAVAWQSTNSLKSVVSALALVFVLLLVLVLALVLVLVLALTLALVLA